MCSEYSGVLDSRGFCQKQANKVGVIGACVQHDVDCKRKKWRVSEPSALKHTQGITQSTANSHRNPGPPYQPGQSVWLPTKNIQQVTLDH